MEGQAHVALPQAEKWGHLGILEGKCLYNKMNPGYFPLVATALKPQQIPMFLHISARIWGRR